MANQYVQHISGQGAKWEVRAEYLGHSDWRVVAHGLTAFHYLPKSEYRLCEPPGVWKDVTAECEVDPQGWISHKGQWTGVGYRLRKVQLWQTHGSGGIGNREMAAVIIEQKVE